MENEHASFGNSIDACRPPGVDQLAFTHASPLYRDGSFSWICELCTFVTEESLICLLTLGVGDKRAGRKCFIPNNTREPVGSHECQIVILKCFIPTIVTQTG